MADGGAQAGAYQVLAWDGTGVQVGTLEAGQLRLAPVGRELRLADIRNCSAAPGRRWGAATGVDPTSGRHGLWRLELELAGGRTRRLLAGAHPASSPDGRRTAYREGNTILVSDDGAPRITLRPRRGLREGNLRGAMSWSPDGRHLLVGRTGGTLGYELEFSTLEVATGERTDVRQRHLHSIRLI